MTERLSEDYFDDMQKITRHYAKSNNIDLNTGGNDFQDIIDKLAEYETAEDEGRLVVLPCKVGQEMFFPDIIKGIIPLLVSEIWVQESDIKITVKYNGDDDDFKYWRTRFSVLNPDEIGRKFFFGRGEAEKALEDMKKDE